MIGPCPTKAYVRCISSTPVRFWRKPSTSGHPLAWETRRAGILGKGTKRQQLLCLKRVSHHVSDVSGNTAFSPPS
ncbi:unnamed protein product [Caretta caretta]